MVNAPETAKQSVTLVKTALCYNEVSPSKAMKSVRYVSY